MTRLLVHGGTILTQDPSDPVVDSLLVDDGVIVAAGSAEKVAAAVAGDVERLDLAGRFVSPGFIDAHNHFVFGLLVELGVDCRKGRLGSVEELLAAMAQAAADTPAGQWVRGWGYNELELAEGRHPTVDELDAIAPDNPLVIGHASGHMCVANSLALARAGITESTPDPPNGVIDRRRRGGRLTGMLHEGASEMVDVLARNTLIAEQPDSCRRAAHTVARRYAALGITTICDPCVPATVEPLYQELAADDDFPLRIVGLGMGQAGMFTPPLDRVDESPGHGSNGFSISGVKFFADGGEQCAVCMSKRGAIHGALHALRKSIRYRTLLAAKLFSAPVTKLGRDGNIHSGIKFYDDPSLAGVLDRTVGQGLAAAVHAMGNEAIDQVLGAVEHARRRCPDDAIFRMEHAMMPDEASIPRMAPLGIAAVVQPRFVHEFGFPVLLTGMNRPFRVLAFRDLMDHGVLLAGSSDAPVVDPDVLDAIESAVTRRTEHGEVLDKDQALTVDEALAMYTVNAARVVGLDRTHGALTPGRSADFVVLGADPRAVAPEQIGRINVDATYRAGRRVHPVSPPA